MSRYKKSGWFLESERHALSAKGVRTGRHVHSAKWDRCVEGVKAHDGKYNPYAVCTKKLGKESFLKAGGASEEYIVDSYGIGGVKVGEHRYKYVTPPDDLEYVGTGDLGTFYYSKKKRKGYVRVGSGKFIHPSGRFYEEKLSEKDKKFLETGLAAKGSVPEVDWVVTPKRFRHKNTGQVVTQVPILDIGNYEEVLEAKGKKPMFVDEPFGLSRELQPAGKFRDDAYIDKQGRRRKASLNMLGKKTYHVNYNVGKAKYVVNFSDGSQTYSDGSEFFDMKIFKNKKGLQKFSEELESAGYKGE